MNLLVDHPFGDALAGIEVPNWCHGVWQRERLAWPGGEDRAKTVLWIQTPVLFADLRVPPPGQVGEEQGFAGHLLVSGRICAWQRPLDLKPPSGPGDAGAMYRDGTYMLECGIHDNYLEDWRQIADGTRHLAATRGDVRVADGEIQWPAEGLLELLVACGSHVIHAVRDGATASLRYGSFDAASGQVTPQWQVGARDATVAADNPWSIWHDTMAPVARDALLGSLDALPAKT
jgi:hypothetical protein